MAEAKKGLGFVEATNKAMPHKMRRKSWKESKHVYWVNPDADSDSCSESGPLVDESGETCWVSADDVCATDWEII
jgi:hypothetical protein